MLFAADSDGLLELDDMTRLMELMSRLQGDEEARYRCEKPSASLAARLCFNLHYASL